MENFVRTNVFITVLTYPHPSKKYEELVCTAGITEQGEWVRLYPIDYRYLPPEQRFKKYQWIEVELSSKGFSNDPRKESRKPIRSSIRIISDVVKTDREWSERRAIVDSLPEFSLNQLQNLYDVDKTSLGVVRPEKVLDLQIIKETGKWKPGQEEVLKQLLLFSKNKELVKIPYRFKYVFTCTDSVKPHNITLTDWEAGALWLKEFDRLGDEMKAAESVRTKFLNEICKPERDTRFFMGTVLPYNTWLVLGLFWPPRQFTPNLF